MKTLARKKESLYFGFEVTEPGGTFLVTINFTIMECLFVISDDGGDHLEVGVGLHVVLVDVGLDLRVVAVHACFHIARLLVVGTLTSAKHLMIIFLISDQGDDHLDGDEDDHDGDEDDHDGDEDDHDVHLCLIDHLAEGKELLASNLPVFGAPTTFSRALQVVDMAMFVVITFTVIIILIQYVSVTGTHLCPKNDKPGFLLDFVAIG